MERLRTFSPAPLTSQESFTSMSSTDTLPRPASKMSGSPFQEGAFENMTVQTETPKKSEQVVLGQLSYAPTTQTTVVTTTTTTTTKFPPLIMKAPKHLNDLDPKLYPLAGSPTPASIRKFRLNAGGHIALFEEAGDTNKVLEEVSRGIQTPMFPSFLKPVTATGA